MPYRSSLGGADTGSACAMWRSPLSFSRECTRLSPGPVSPIALTACLRSRTLELVSVLPRDAQQILQKADLDHWTSKHSCLVRIFFGLANSCSFHPWVSCGGRVWSAACLECLGGSWGSQSPIFYSWDFWHEALGLDATSCCRDLRLLTWWELVG